MNTMATHAHQSYPRSCAECGKQEVMPTTIVYDAVVKHDGGTHAFRIPHLHINKCVACGEVFFDSLTDEEISQALRKHRNLLSPQEIRAKLARYSLSQKQLAAQIRVAPETISRWLSGAYIQSCASDMLMRLFFAEQEAKHRTPTAGRVVIRDGQVAPWSHSASYQTTPFPQPGAPVESAEDQGELALAA